MPKLRQFTVATDSTAAAIRLIEFVNANPTIWFNFQDGEPITTERPRRRYIPTNGYYSVEKVTAKRKAVKKAA